VTDVPDRLNVCWNRCDRCDTDRRAPRHMECNIRVATVSRDNVNPHRRARVFAGIVKLAEPPINLNLRGKYMQFQLNSMSEPVAIGNLLGRHRNIDRQRLINDDVIG